MKRSGSKRGRNIIGRTTQVKGAEGTPGYRDSGEARTPAVTAVMAERSAIACGGIRSGPPSGLIKAATSAWFSSACGLSLQAAGTRTLSGRILQKGPGRPRPRISSHSTPAKMVLHCWTSDP